MIDPIPGLGGSGTVRPAEPVADSQQTPVIGPAGGVASAFRDALIAAGKDHDLQLSNHAVKRLEQRQIDLQDDQLERLRKAMDSLADRGGRQSLVMLDQVAYVVDIPSHTVVTAVQPGGDREAVFTQIDSVAIA